MITETQQNPSPTVLLQSSWHSSPISRVSSLEYLRNLFWKNKRYISHPMMLEGFCWFFFFWPLVQQPFNLHFPHLNYFYKCTIGFWERFCKGILPLLFPPAPSQENTGWWLGNPRWAPHLICVSRILCFQQIIDHLHCFPHHLSWSPVVWENRIHAIHYLYGSASPLLIWGKVNFPAKNSKRFYEYNISLPTRSL